MWTCLFDFQTTLAFVFPANLYLLFCCCFSMQNNELVVSNALSKLISFLLLSQEFHDFVRYICSILYKITILRITFKIICLRYYVILLCGSIIENINCMDDRGLTRKAISGPVHLMVFFLLEILSEMSVSPGYIHFRNKRYQDLKESTHQAIEIAPFT